MGISSNVTEPAIGPASPGRHRRRRPDRGLMIGTRWASLILALGMIGAALSGCLPQPTAGVRLPGLIQAPPAPLARVDHGLMAVGGPIRFPIEANVGQATDRVAYLVRIGGMQVGARQSKPLGAVPAEASINYFVGPPEAWKTNVPAFQQVVYPDVWPGISAAYQRVGGGLKSSFHLEPGADPSLIRLAYQGGQPRVAEDGTLELSTPLGPLRESAPVAWQDGRNGREPVAVRWEIMDGPDGETDEVGFRLGAYDPARPLVIDPTLGYTSYLGGSNEDIGTSIAVDAGGSVYVTGDTMSSQATFPTGGGFVGTPGFDQGQNGDQDAF